MGQRVGVVHMSAVACGNRRGVVAPVVIRRSHQNPLEMELLAAESYPCSCWELTLGPRGEHCVLLPTKSSVC